MMCRQPVPDEKLLGNTRASTKLNNLRPYLFTESLRLNVQISVFFVIPRSSAGSERLESTRLLIEGSWVRVPARKLQMVNVAQLARALHCGCRCREFDSHHSPDLSSRRITVSSPDFRSGDAGSIPAGSTGTMRCEFESHLSKVSSP